MTNPVETNDEQVQDKVGQDEQQEKSDESPKIESDKEGQEVDLEPESSDEEEYTPEKIKEIVEENKRLQKRNKVLKENKQKHIAKAEGQKVEQEARDEEMARVEAERELYKFLSEHPEAKDYQDSIVEAQNQHPTLSHLEAYKLVAPYPSGNAGEQGIGIGKPAPSKPTVQENLGATIARQVLADLWIWKKAKKGA